MKQTAVEWFVEQLPERMKNYLNDSIAIAKAMEKEQIIKAYDRGYDEYDIYRNGQNYYIETYEQDKQG
jgi:hypothetical protein